MKKTWNLPTVWVALAAVVLAFISVYMPWVTYRDESASLTRLIAEDPDYFVGILPMIYVGLIWVAAFFLLNFPKLSLIGNLPLLFCGAAMLFAILDTGFEVGFGLILYFLMIAVMVVMAFATKKIRKPKAEA